MELTPIRVRNVKTGEFRDVTPDEFEELKSEVYDHQGSIRPLWEQPGQHQVRRVVEDADEGALAETDHGYDHKPVGQVLADTTEVGPEPAPHTALTPGEIDSGITSWDQKQEQLAEQHGESAVHSQEVADERTKAAAEAVSGSEGRPPKRSRKAERESKRSRKGAQSKGQTGRAGGEPPEKPEDKSGDSEGS